MEEQKETLKEEEKQLPTDTGLSEEETTEDTNDDSTDVDDSDDDSVTISKAELEQLKSDNENYRIGIKKAKLKNLKLPHTEKPAEKQEDVFEEPEKFLTKADYYKSIEQAAIDKSLADESMPNLDKHYDNIMLYYANRHGNTVEGYLKNIKDAYFLWEKNASSPKDEGKLKTKKDTAGLVQEQGVGQGEKTDTTPKKRKSVLPKKESISEWYDKK